MLTPDMFQGETVHILGGGPSMADFDCSVLRLDPVIAVNNAGLDIFPDADILFVMDSRWFNWNRHRVGENHSGIRVTRQFQAPTNWQLPWPVTEVEHDKFGDFSESLDRLAGTHGGAMALNLAALTGAETIILHGFDMRPGNYHTDHKTPSQDHLYQDSFIPSLEGMAPHLARMGVKVGNATPGSALKCFPSTEQAA